MSDLAVPERFSVRVLRRGDAGVVVPTGELDYGSAPALEASAAGHRGLQRTLEVAGVHHVFSWAPAGEIT